MNTRALKQITLAAILLTLTGLYNHKKNSDLISRMNMHVKISQDILENTLADLPSNYATLTNDFYDAIIDEDRLIEPCDTNLNVLFIPFSYSRRCVNFDYLDCTQKSLNKIVEELMIYDQQNPLPHPIPSSLSESMCNNVLSRKSDTCQSDQYILNLEILDQYIEDVENASDK